jgi:hypothetical protein
MRQHCSGCHLVRGKLLHRFGGVRIQKAAERDSGKEHGDDRKNHDAVVARRDGQSVQLLFQKFLIASIHGAITFKPINAKKTRKGGWMFRSGRVLMPLKEFFYSAIA